MILSLWDKFDLENAKNLKKALFESLPFPKKILICDKNFRWYEQSIKELGESKKLKKKF